MIGGLIGPATALRSIRFGRLPFLLPLPAPAPLPQVLHPLHRRDQQPLPHVRAIRYLVTLRSSRFTAACSCFFNRRDHARCCGVRFLFWCLRRIVGLLCEVR